MKRSQSPGLGTEAGQLAQRPRHVTDTARLNYLEQPVEPYEALDRYDYRRHEALPIIPASHPEFRQMLNLIEQAVITILGPVNAIPEYDHELGELVNELTRKTVVNFGEPVRVAVVGDTGAGKSSFLNVLLQHADLAAEGDGGAACTQVITEYVDDPDLSAGHAKVHFKSKDFIDNEIRLMFMNYINSNTEETGSSDGNDEDEGDDESLKQEQSKTAEEFFTQLFAQRMEFATERSFYDFMTALEPDEYDKKIAELQTACESELMGRFSDVEKRTVDIKRTDLTGITSALKEYAETQNIPGQAGFWPVVDRISLHLDSPLLRKGLRVADCPGISDTNITRRTTTLRYLRTCSVVVILGVCTRIMDSPSIQGYLRTYIAQLGGPRVILMPTKCEDVRQSPRKGLLPEEATTLENLKRRSDEAAIAKDKATSGTSEYKNAKQAKIEADLILKRTRALTRKNILIRELQRKSASKAFGKASAGLHIIPTSSEAQSVYMRGDAADDPPIFTPSEAGIATARSVICKIALTGQLNAVKRHLNVSLQFTFNKLEMVLQKCPSERINNLLAMIEQPLSAAKSNFGSYQDGIRRGFQIAVASKMPSKYSNDQSPWSLHVRDLVDSWKGEFSAPGTLKAFARRYGIHKPARKGLTNWNEKILSVVREDMAVMIDGLKVELDSVKREIEEDVFSAAKTLEENIRSSGDIGGHNMEPFWDNFEIHKKKFTVALEKRFTKLIDKVRYEFEPLMSGFEDSPFLDAMGKIYENLQGLKFTKKPGYNVTMQRYDHFYEMIKLRKTGYPFVELQRGLEDTFEALLGEQLEELLKIISEPFDGFRDDFGRRFGSSNESGLSPERREVLRHEVEGVMPLARDQIKAAKEIAAGIGEWMVENERKEKLAREMPMVGVKVEGWDEDK